jgi:hypothetical protein
LTPTAPGPEPRIHSLPEVGLADLVRVAVTLRPNPAVLEAVAEMLGLVRMTPLAEPATVNIDSISETLRPRTKAASQSTAVTEPDLPTEHRLSVPVSATYIPPTAPVPSGQTARNLADLLPEGPDPKSLQGLFPAQRSRALLSHLAGRLRPDGDFDDVAAVDFLTRREPLLELPRLWIETTRGGFELVLDIGVGMQPYRSDLDQLREQLSRVIGRDSFEIRWFEDCPIGGHGIYMPGKLEPEPYHPPPAGTLILVVTTFGVCGGFPAPSSVVKRWHKFAAAAARARTPLIALTPLPHERRLASLARQLAIVTWDQTTRVHDVTDATRSLTRSTSRFVQGN